MWRGSAVEAGLDLWLFKRDLGAAQEAALVRFEQDAQGVADEETDKERRNIAPMLTAATGLPWPSEPPLARQLKCEYWFDGIEVPLLMFIDYEFSHILRELKTTKNMPSAVPDNHARQGAIYSTVKQRPLEFVYLTPKKAEIKPLVDTEKHLRMLGRYAHSVRAYLALTNDKQDAAQIFPPNYDHYYYKSEKSKLAAQKIWAI